MRKAFPILAVLAALALAGCDETTTAPRDVTPPAAPRGVFSVTGASKVTLHWLENTEADLAGYRLYKSPCASGDPCPYDRIGATSATEFAVTGLANGVTRYFAVAAVDKAGNESALSPEIIFDTPRPEGSGTLNNFVNGTTGAGWNFSAFAATSSTSATCDIFFGDNGLVSEMFTKDTATRIQDAGYASNLDAVDFAPLLGWSPTGTVELILGHCYIVATRDEHFAKFRVTGISGTLVSFDWAYQTDTLNRELRARPAHPEPAAPRPVVWLRERSRS